MKAERAIGDILDVDEKDVFTGVGAVGVFNGAD